VWPWDQTFWCINSFCLTYFKHTDLCDRETRRFEARIVYVWLALYLYQAVWLWDQTFWCMNSFCLTYFLHTDLCDRETRRFEARIVYVWLALYLYQAVWPWDQMFWCMNSFCLTYFIHTDLCDRETRRFEARIVYVWLALYILICVTVTPDVLSQEKCMSVLLYTYWSAVWPWDQTFWGKDSLCLTCFILIPSCVTVRPVVLMHE
jgi:hypothetical protein